MNALLWIFFVMVTATDGGPGPALMVAAESKEECQAAREGMLKAGGQVTECAQKRVRVQ